MAAQAKQFEEYRDYLRLLAQMSLEPRLQGKIDPSDLVQQTLLRAHATADQFVWQGNVQQASFLRKILANCMADAVRQYASGARNVALERSLDISIEQSASRIEAWLAADQTGPTERAMRNELNLKMATALMQLPQDQRRAVELKHLHGESLKEIAEKMDKSVTAVAGLLRRGLDKLRAELADDK